MYFNMYKVITEATIIGLIILIIGRMIMGLTMNEYKNKKHPKGMSFAFFCTGFLLHFVIEFLGINCWYCDKKCAVYNFFFK